MALIERWIIYSVLALLSWVVFTHGARPVLRSAVAEDPSPAKADTVSARVFLVVDERGNRCAELSAAGGAPVLRLRDGSGRVRAALFLGGDGQPALVLQDPRERMRAMLALRDDEAPMLQLADGGTRVRASLMLMSDGAPGFALLDGKQVRASLRLADDGEPALRLSDPSGRVRATVGTSQLEGVDSGATETTAPSSVVLFDRNGKVLWRAPPK